MHESIFRYNITRPYPYPWFKWAVFIGGIAATALLSAINLAATGYDLSNSAVTNPNETEHPKSPEWFQKSPWSWFTKVFSECQPQTLTVGSSFYTNNLALPYTIIGLHTGPQNQSQPISSFAYKNDNFHDCLVRTLSIQPWDLEIPARPVTASIDCTVHNGLKAVNMTLSTSFAVGRGLVPSPDGKEVFLALDPYSQPSLQWGSNLLGYYPFYFDTKMESYWEFSTTSPSQDPKTVQITAKAFSNDTAKSLVMSIGTVTPVSLDSWGSAFGDDVEGRNIIAVADSIATAYYYPANISQFVWSVYLNDFALALFSIILTDLGQPVDANVFASPQRTLDFVNKTVHIEPDSSSSPYARRWQSIVRPLGMSSSTLETDDPPSNLVDFYNWADTGLPQISPTVVSTQYLCQVPKLKPTGALVVSIIVADLVFLQAIWAVFTWVVTYFLQRQMPESKYCPGCAAPRTEEKPGAGGPFLWSPSVDESYEALTPSSERDAKSSGFHIDVTSLSPQSTSSLHLTTETSFQPLLASPETVSLSMEKFPRRGRLWPARRRQERENDRRIR